MDTEDRAEGTIGGTPIRLLPPSSFAYCEPGDAAVSTRCYFPIRDKNGKADAAHVRAALSRLSQSSFEAKARPAIEKAAKELGIGEREAVMGEYETRVSDIWPDMEMRATRDGLVIEGYAVPFDKPSLPIPSLRGPFTETMRAGAFTAALGKKPDVLMKYQHNHLSLPTGRTTAGTLELGADTAGLTYRNRLPDNEAGRPIFDAIERRDITGVSISFAVKNKNHERWSDDGSERQVFQASLGHEMSYVDHPAYPDTTAVALRSLAEEAGIDGDELVRVFGILVEPDGKLTAPERDLVMEAINKRTDAPFVGPNLAAARERLARIRKTA